MLVTSVQTLASRTPSKQHAAAYCPPLQQSPSLAHVAPRVAHAPQNPSALQGWPLQQPPVPICAHCEPSLAHLQMSSWLQ
jgi:hypothetical protein